MIPVQLIFEGLYSYQDRQTIDFTALTDAGLFGVFGAVGSGKSSILEAITFALYDDVERMNKNDKRLYNMMNLKSNRLYIEFDFINYQEKKYKIVRELQRNAKKFDTVISKSAVLYEWIDEEWIPLESANVEPIIGLSYANFKRTIIIPQGQFKEFLELKPTERTGMLKDIFGLQQYDLSDKVSSLIKLNKSDIDQLEGQLMGFEFVSEEEISAKKEIFTAAQIQFTTIQSEKKIIEEKFQLMKTLKEDIESLKAKKVQLQSLEEKEVYFKKLNEQITLFETYHKIFSAPINEVERLEGEFITCTKEYEISNTLFEEIKANRKLVLKKLEEIEPEYLTLETKKKEYNDYLILARIIKLSSEIEVFKSRSKEGAEAVESQSKLEKEKIKEIEKKEKEIEELTKNKIDSSIFMELQEWFSNEQILQLNKEALQKKIDLNQQELTNLEIELTNKGWSETTFVEIFKKENDRLDKDKIALEIKKSQLDLQEQLAKYTHNLVDGENCPLCGAIEHPSIAQHSNVTAEIEEVKLKLIERENDKLKIDQQNREFEKWVSKKETISRQKQELGIEFLELEKRLINMHSCFKWSSITSTDRTEFELKKVTNIQLEGKINTSNSQLRSERLELASIQEKLEKFKNALLKFEQEVSEKRTTIIANEELLSILKWSNFEKSSIEYIENAGNELLTKNNKIEVDFTTYTKSFNEINLKNVSQETKVNSLLELKKSLTEKLKNAQIILEEKLRQTEDTNIKDVKEILAQDLNVIALRSEIQEFTITLETLKNGIKELEQKLKGNVFDSEQFLILEQQVQEVENKWIEVTERVAQMEAEIKRLTKAFEDKKTLLIQQNEFQKRAQNLSTLSSMFKAAGFVEYVARIYLQQLCVQANVRFHRMTRNQLSLQMNDSHFEIIDYLNEGKSRSVKTLSGGQSFQVSLCLALALAESVQASTLANRNFFFIDEGFGTQDAESINIVFETLSGLQKENRIVGIISHVEELKERIPIALQIRKDIETGSFIEVIR